jgi:uncharacterized membrane-anchored protein
VNLHTEVTLSKVPEITLIFWIIKIVATTLGWTQWSGLAGINPSLQGAWH